MAQDLETKGTNHINFPKVGPNMYIGANYKDQSYNLLMIRQGKPICWLKKN